MGVGADLYMYDVVVKMFSRSLSHLLMSSCNAVGAKRINMRNRAKFRGDRSTTIKALDFANFRFSRCRPSTILDFEKFGILRAIMWRGSICVIIPNLCRSVKPFPRYRDFSAFQIVAVRHLGFLRSSNVWERVVFRRSLCACQISWQSVKPLPRYSDFVELFKNGGRPPYWIRRVRIWTTYREHLVVFVIVRNLVGIDAVVSTTWRF